MADDVCLQDPRRYESVVKTRQARSMRRGPIERDVRETKKSRLALLPGGKEDRKDPRLILVGRQRVPCAERDCVTFVGSTLIVLIV